MRGCGWEHGWCQVKCAGLEKKSWIYENFEPSPKILKIWVESVDSIVRLLVDLGSNLSSLRCIMLRNNNTEVITGTEIRCVAVFLCRSFVHCTGPRMEKAEIGKEMDRFVRLEASYYINGILRISVKWSTTWEALGLIFGNGMVRMQPISTDDNDCLLLLMGYCSSTLHNSIRSWSFIISHCNGPNPSKCSTFSGAHQLSTHTFCWRLAFCIVFSTTELYRNRDSANSDSEGRIADITIIRNSLSKFL